MIPEDQKKPLVILLYVTLAASLWKCLPVPAGEVSGPLTLASPAFWWGSQKLIGSLLLFGLVPMLIVKFVFREKLADYGLRPGILKFTVRSFLLMAPFVAVLAVWTGHQPAFFDVYPFNEALRTRGTVAGGPIPYGIFAVHAVLYLGYYFGWEFLFRGFLQHGLAPRCGLVTAVLVQTLATTMLHYGHPPTEVFASVVAGLVWGLLAVRTRSLLSGMAQHTLLGIVLDAVLIYR